LMGKFEGFGIFEGVCGGFVGGAGRGEEARRMGGECVVWVVGEW